MANSTLLNQAQDALFTFISSEIDVSHTRADMALRALDDSSKRDRNAEKAYSGYRVILRFIGSEFLSEQQRAELKAKIQTLEEQLIALAEIKARANGSTAAPPPRCRQSRA